MCAQLNLGGSGTETPAQGRARLEVPYTEVSGVFTSHFVQANTFIKVQWVSAGATWILASMDDRDEQADGLIFKANSTEFWVVTSGDVPLLAHGLGAAGDTLWLDLAGATSTTGPSGGTMKLRQRVGRVTGADSILVMIEHPEVF